MGDLLFFIKMVLFTFVFVLMMQVKIGSTTVEERILTFTHQSQVGIQLQKIADNGLVALNRLWQSMGLAGKAQILNRSSELQVPGKRLKAKIRDWQGELEQASSEAQEIN